MAQIVKAKKNNKYIDVEKEKEKNEKNSNNNKVKKIENSKKTKPKKEEKNSLWTRFMIFCHGVKSEVSKVRWTNKQDMVKYSVATIVFIIFCSLFFYGIDFIFALIQSLVKGA